MDSVALRLAVLASGSGTLLEAMAERLPIALVMVDRPCRAEEVARTHGLECVRVERTDFGRGFDRERFTGEVVAELRSRGIDLVAMAGWGTVLSASAFEAFPGRIVNTHPSLLPSFPGWHAVRDALEAGVKVTGCTVHLATPEVDDGPILAQEPVRVQPGDDEAALHERIKDVERELYPRVLGDLLVDRAG